MNFKKMFELHNYGVQYVHCVMYKCIMVKLGGNEKHIKYVQTRKFYEIRGEFAKVIISPK